MRSTAIGIDPADAPYILDDSGQPAISRIDQATLRSIASQLGVPYATRSAEGDIEPLVEGIDVETVVEDGRQIETVTRPVVWPLAIVALGLLGWELLALAGLLPGPRSEWDET